MIAAILRAQLLSMRWGRHRGAWFSLITAVIWYGFWSGIAVALYQLAELAPESTLSTAVASTLLFACLYWQVAPIISASMGSALDMRKLLLYPAQHWKLFLVEVLLRLTSGGEMVLVLAGGVAGLLRNPAAGGWAAAPRLITALFVYVLFNLLLASGIRSLLDRLLSRRRLREVLILLFVLVVTAPRLLIAFGAGPQALQGWGSVIRLPFAPWRFAAQVALGESMSVSLLALLAWTTLAGWFGRRQFEHSLRYDSLAAQATDSGPVSPDRERRSEWFYRSPSLLFRDPLAAIVEKELRSLARTPRFRMIFVMGFSFGVMVWLPLILGRQAERHGALAQNFLVVVCIYAVTLLGQVTYWNCFGFDRSAAQFYFAAPASIWQTLIGKNLASLFFIYLEVSILIVVTVILRVEAGIGKLVEALLVVGVCCLYMMAFGNISSVRYPRALAPERVSQGGASSRFQALVFILYPLALVPVFLAYLARYAFNSQAAFAMVLALAAAIGGVLYWLALESAVKTAEVQRERMLTDLSRGEGPVVSS